MKPGGAIHTLKLPAPPVDYPSVPQISAETVKDCFLSVGHKPNYANAKIHVDSHLNVDTWRHYEPIINEVDPTLVDQIDCGFYMGINHDFDFSIPVTNHLSARTQFSAIDDFLIKHYTGWFTHRSI